MAQELLSARMRITPKGYEEILDNMGVDYDIDDGGRVMLRPSDVSEVTEALEMADYEVDEL